MRKGTKVRYIPIDGCYVKLTSHKVYEVIKYKNNHIKIFNDEGSLVYYCIYSFDSKLEFIDVTRQYRNEIIDGILL